MSPAPLGAIWTLAYLTCPVALGHHHPFSFTFVLLTNAATYALVGTLAETAWRHYSTHLVSGRH
jgi:hypothetical protein